MRLSLDLGEDDYDPAVFVEAAQFAEKQGFSRVWLGDHFMPWVHSGNRSAFVWSVLAVCLDRTSSIQAGPYVTSPIGGRYHPAIVAQAVATLDNMYPGRCLLGVGTGEAVNEASFFERGWPNWKERVERLVEGLRLIEELFKMGTPFDFEGKYFKMKDVMLYTKPKTNIPFYFSAVGEKSAFLAGKHAGNIITLTTHNSLERCGKVILPAFEKGLREAGRDPSKSEKIGSLSFTFEDRATYVNEARKRAGLIAPKSWDVRDPRVVEELGKSVDEKRIVDSTFFCENWDDLAQVIKSFGRIGFTEIVLYTGPKKESIREVAENLLPNFKD